jgi:beta-lactamase superfamily II metal-dependent hydrolase
MLLRPLALVVLATALAACSDSPSGPPDAVAPVITITGVAAGGTYPAPVAVGISVDRGSYTATLNGAAFPAAGGTVADPGQYELVVSARSGSATSEARVAFTVRFAGSRVLIVRLFDLGDNESGGGGDAILLTDSTGSGMRHALIDAGPQGVDASNPGYVLQRLQALGVTRLDFVQLTHAHADHYAGLSQVLNGIPVGWFVYNGQQRANIGGYQTVLTAARARADSVVVPAAVTELPFGYEAGAVRVVPPLTTYLANSNASGDELNEGSLGTSLRRGTFSMFFTGDGEMEANARWRTSFPALSGGVTALKVGHHGANDAVFDNGFSGSSAWLAHTAPQIAVISANGRSHPRINALTAILGWPATETYCTSVHGDIAIRVAESGQYAVTVQRDATMDCRAGIEATT